MKKKRADIYVSYVMSLLYFLYLGPKKISKSVEEARNGDIKKITVLLIPPPVQQLLPGCGALEQSRR